MREKSVFPEYGVKCVPPCCQCYYFSEKLKYYGAVENHFTKIVRYSVFFTKSNLSNVKKTSLFTKCTNSFKKCFPFFISHPERFISSFVSDLKFVYLISNGNNL